MRPSGFLPPDFAGYGGHLEILNEGNLFARWGDDEIRILIADDSELVRRAIKNLLIQDSTDWICGEVDNGQAAVREVGELLPNVLLLDVSIPVVHGVTVARLVKKGSPSGKGGGDE